MLVNVKLTAFGPSFKVLEYLSRIDFYPTVIHDGVKQRIVDSQTGDYTSSSELPPFPDMKYGFARTLGADTGGFHKDRDGRTFEAVHRFLTENFDQLKLLDEYEGIAFKELYVIVEKAQFDLSNFPIEVSSVIDKLGFEVMVEEYDFSPRRSVFSRFWSKLTNPGLPVYGTGHDEAPDITAR